MSDSNALGQFLAEHPRMIGALFVMVLLLTQAGSTVAANGTTIGG